MQLSKVYPYINWIPKSYLEIESSRPVVPNGGGRFRRASSRFMYLTSAEIWWLNRACATYKLPLAQSSKRQRNVDIFMQTFTKFFIFDVDIIVKIVVIISCRRYEWIFWILPRQNWTLEWNKDDEHECCNLYQFYPKFSWFKLSESL